MKFLSAMLLSALFGLANAQSSLAPALISDAKSLDASANEEASLQKFLEALKFDPNNYEATWNTSFLYARVGNRIADQDKKVEYFKMAKQYADKAFQLDSNDAESNYVMAVAMGRMALISPTKEKVAASRDIKKFTERAIQLNPNHAGAYYVLGKWNYEVANLNWAEKAAANYLFGGIPEGSLDEAIRNYLTAIKLNPTYILCYYDLAQALGEKEFYDEEIRVLTKALTLKPLTEDDPSILIKCKALLDTVKK